MTTRKQQRSDTKNEINAKHSRLARQIRQKFYPDLIVPSPRSIPYDRLASMGFRIVLLDVDNTLVTHGSHEGDDFAKEIVLRVQKAGLIPVIASNAREHRARSFANSLGIDFIAQAKKPGIDAICLELTARSCERHNALMVGDQLLTDVWAARKANIPVILTQKRAEHEIITVKMKRVIERLLRFLGGKSEWEALKLKNTDDIKRSLRP